jgi:hypothetical protein
MPATFTIEVDRLLTHDVGELVDVVRLVDWRLVASEGGLNYEMPCTCTLEPPDPVEFVPFAELTLAIVQGWILDQEARLPGMQVAAQDVLTARLARTELSDQGPPWA